jgi:hypothetical protein
VIEPVLDCLLKDGEASSRGAIEHPGSQAKLVNIYGTEAVPFVPIRLLQKRYLKGYLVGPVLHHLPAKDFSRTCRAVGSNTPLNQYR